MTPKHKHFIGQTLQFFGGLQIVFLIIYIVGQKPCMYEIFKNGPFFELCEMLQHKKKTLYLQGLGLGLTSIKILFLFLSFIIIQ